MLCYATIEKLQTKKIRYIAFLAANQRHVSNSNTLCFDISIQKLAMFAL